MVCNLNSLNALCGLVLAGNWTIDWLIDRQSLVVWQTDLLYAIQLNVVNRSVTDNYISLDRHC